MNHESHLRWKVDPIKLRNVDTQPNCDVIRIAIEILEVDTRIENASALIELALHSDLATIQIKNNAGMVAYKSTGTVELGDNKFFIHGCLRGKIEIAGESGV